MNIKFLIKNGHLTGVTCVLFFLIGLGALYVSVKYIHGHTAKMFGVSIGMMLMAIGGYAAKASALHLRPFGESPWRKAKRSYKEDDPLDPKG